MSTWSERKASLRFAMTPLMLGAADGDESSVRRELLLPANQQTLNNVWKNGKTALGFAAAAGHERIADMLIAAGADVNLTTPLPAPEQSAHNDAGDKRRRSLSVPPMVAAAANGHWSIVRKLIAANANVNATCGRGRTTLLYAAAADEFEIAKELVIAGANVVGERLKGKLSPIIVASHKGHSSLFTYIAMAAKRPNAATATPYDTKLWSAVIAGDEEQVDELLLAAPGAGADNASMVYADGSSLLDYAAGREHWTIVFKLIAAYPQPGVWPLGSVLETAFSKANMSAMAALLSAGADPTLRLIKRCARDYIPIHVGPVALLLAAGATVPVQFRVHELQCLGVSLPISAAIATLFAALGTVIVTENPDLLRTIEDGKAGALKTIELAGFRAIRARALEVCIALHNLRLSALEQTEILRFACTPFATYLPFHYLWNAVVTVKHFRKPMK
jgi:ankyrin repeat protein